jgi:hypothetical protein
MSRLSFQTILPVVIGYHYHTGVVPAGRIARPRSGLARLLAVHGHNLDPVRLELQRRVQLERRLLDDEGPHVVAEAIRVEVALRRRQLPSNSRGAKQTNLELHAGLDLVTQHLGNVTVEVHQHLDGDLRLDAALGDEGVEGVDQRGADARGVSAGRAGGGVRGRRACSGGTARSLGRCLAGPFWVQGSKGICEVRKMEMDGQGILGVSCGEVTGSSSQSGNFTLGLHLRVIVA